MHPTAVGIDLAKHVFQVHGIDDAGVVVIRKKLRRSELRSFFAKLPSCLGGMEACQRLATILGVGVITATAMVATVADAGAFRSGRHFAAWIGLVPRQNGTGGKVHLGRISKQGEPYLRRLLVLGATAGIRRMGKRAVHTTVGARGDGGCRQQACADRLGDHAAWRIIPRKAIWHCLRLIWP